MDKVVFKNLIKLSAGILVISGIWGVVQCQCVNIKVFTPAHLKDYIQSFGKIAVAVYIFAYVLNTLSVFPPVAALSLTAGILFGKLWGAIYLLIGAMIGTSCTFFISRFFGRGMVEKILKGKFRNLDELLERKGFSTILFFRVIPIIPYEVINYAGGLSKIKFKDYFFATFLGLIPGVIVATFFGSSLSEIKKIKDIFSWQFVIILLAVILIVSLPLIYRRIKRKREIRL